MTARKSASNSRRRGPGRPFAPGNAGKPVGARHTVTRAVEVLLEGEAEALTRTVIEAAKGGDMTALRLCLDRIAPLRRGRVVQFDLPPTDTIEGASKALGAILAAVAAGELTPDEGASVGALLETRRRAIETVEFGARVASLEARLSDNFEAEAGR